MNGGLCILRDFACILQCLRYEIFERKNCLDFLAFYLTRHLTPFWRSNHPPSMYSSGVYPGSMISPGIPRECLPYTPKTNFPKIIPYWLRKPLNNLSSITSSITYAHLHICCASYVFIRDLDQSLKTTLLRKNLPTVRTNYINSISIDPNEHFNKFQWAFH